jgi:hypothetical protein
MFLLTSEIGYVDVFSSMFKKYNLKVLILFYKIKLISLFFFSFLWDWELNPEPHLLYKCYTAWVMLSVFCLFLTEVGSH